jgi:2-octaprenyl-6-methoxyphenol hydroxylase
MKFFDVLIVGGGLVGNSLAYALAKQGLQVGIVEARPPSLSTDQRSIVLSYSSHIILQTLGLWSELATQANPIDKVQVKQRGYFGSARFSANEFNIPALGYVIPANILTNALQQAVMDQAGITVIAPAELQQFEVTVDHVQVKFKIADNQQSMTTRLIIAADGSYSRLRQMQRIATTQNDYEQTAIITTVTTDQSNQNTAFECLTPTGPLALLPRKKNECGVVWTVGKQEAEAILDLPDQEFLTRLQESFGYRLGKFLTVVDRSAYPLQLVIAQQQVQQGLVLVGNAAHTLHPLAGQGFNLALRDIAALAEVLVVANKEGKKIGDLTVLQQYENWRAQEQKNIVRFSDKTVKTLAKQQPWMELSICFGLFTLGLFPVVRKQLIRRLLGFSGRAPKLVCGIPL